jgi:hypothetical protein
LQGSVRPLRSHRHGVLREDDIFEISCSQDEFLADAKTQDAILYNFEKITGSAREDHVLTTCTSNADAVKKGHRAAKGMDSIKPALRINRSTFSRISSNGVLHSYRYVITDVFINRGKRMFYCIFYPNVPGGTNELL